MLGCSLATVTIWYYNKVLVTSFERESETASKTDYNNNDTSTENDTYTFPSADESKNKRHSRLFTPFPPEIRNEQLSRHQLYFGEEGMRSLQSAKVCVVGLGGVGSHAAHMLARAGIGMIRLIDFDQVTVSSLNRHAVASLHDVGIPKVVCLANYIRRHICPDPSYLRIETFNEMYTAESGNRLLSLDSENGSVNTSSKCSWSMVIDCIDDIPTKAELIRQCLEKNVRVVSCMGAGGKADFTRLHWSDLRTASKDPLATKLRQTLKSMYSREGKTESTTIARSRNGRSDDDYLDNMDRLSVLYSSEKTVVKLADFTEEQKQSGYHQYGSVDGMRIRVVPVLGTMPAIFGQALATICLTIIGNKEIQPVTGERIGRNVRNRIYQHLKSREQKIADQVLDNAKLKKVCLDSITPDRFGGMIVNGTYICKSLQVDQEDVEYLLELWRNKCAVTGDRLGVVLELVRWDLTKPTICSNLVLVSSNAISNFDLLHVEANKKNMDPAVRHRIESRLESCRIDVNG